MATKAKPKIAPTAKPAPPLDGEQVAVAVPPPTGEFGVLVCVPTRGYPWHETAKALEPYNPQYVLEKLNVANARNRIVREFLKTKADVLVMCDDDVIPPVGFVEALLNTPYDVVSAPTPIAKFPRHPIFLNSFNVNDEGRFYTVPTPGQDTPHIPVDAVGTGCVLIHRRVLAHPALKRPFDQKVDEDGVVITGQDLNFSNRVKDAGFSIGANYDVLCDHFISIHANACAMAYHQPKEPGDVVEPVG